MSCGISAGFPTLSPSARLVAHALLARPPLSPRAQHSAPKFLHVLFTWKSVMLEFRFLHAPAPILSFYYQLRSQRNTFLSHDAVGYLFHRLFALSAEHADPVRLACVRRAASVRPEPGSNPQTKYLSVCPGDESHSSARTYILCVFRLLVLAKQLNYSRRPWIHRNP